MEFKLILCFKFMSIFIVYSALIWFSGACAKEKTDTIIIKMKCIGGLTQNIVIVTSFIKSLKDTVNVIIRYECSVLFISCDANSVERYFS